MVVHCSNNIEGRTIWLLPFFLAIGYSRVLMHRLWSRRGPWGWISQSARDLRIRKSVFLPCTGHFVIHESPLWYKIHFPPTNFFLFPVAFMAFFTCFSYLYFSSLATLTGFRRNPFVLFNRGGCSLPFSLCLWKLRFMYTYFSLIFHTLHIEKVNRLRYYLIWGAHFFRVTLC